MNELNEKEEERVRSMIRLYAKELEEKMNYRLLLEQDNKENTCLFVEQITAADIFFPEKKKREIAVKKVGRKILDRILLLFHMLSAAVRRLLTGKGAA